MGGGVLRGGADNVLVNLTICEDFVKIPKTHNRYLSKFPGDARHRAKPSRQVFAMSIASSSLPERFWPSTTLKKSSLTLTLTLSPPAELWQVMNLNANHDK